MRYVVGLFIALGLIIVLIILLISGGNKTTTPRATSRSFSDYAATDAQVSLTIDGPVNADSLHEQIRITVDNTTVTYQHLHGYQGDVVDTRVFTNNQDAYGAFLQALLHAGFTLGSNDPALKDERGYCATHDRFIFEMTQDDKTLERYWNTSCNNTKTYLGNTDLTITLFQAQVPGYADLTKNIQL